jgi:hypothetical protein
MLGSGSLRGALLQTSTLTFRWTCLAMFASRQAKASTNTRESIEPGQAVRGGMDTYEDEQFFGEQLQGREALWGNLYRPWFRHCIQSSIYVNDATGRDFYTNRLIPKRNVTGSSGRNWKTEVDSSALVTRSLKLMVWMVRVSQQPKRQLMILPSRQALLHAVIC